MTADADSAPVIVDTDVFSFLLKGDTRAALYQPDIEGKTIAVSFVTVGELYRWAYLKKWGPRRLGSLEQSLRRVVMLPGHDGVARQWARIQSIPGRSFGDNDAWQAACAMAYGCVLITHDRHFTDMPGLSVVSHLP